MNKKNTKNLTDQQPLYKYNKVFINEQRSPTNVASTTLRAQKMAEYATSDRNKLPLSPQPSVNQRSQLQEQAGQNESKGSKQGQRQLSRKEHTQINTSRSKEKKDRLTLNLAKFGRKQTDKAKSPTNNREKNVQTIYLERAENLEAGSSQNHEDRQISERREGYNEKATIKEEPSIQRNQNANRRSLFSQDFESIMSENQQGSNSIAINEAPKSRAEVAKKQAPLLYQYDEKKRDDYVKAPASKRPSIVFQAEKQADQVERKWSKQAISGGSQGLIDRQIYEMLRGQQNANTQELNNRLKIQKEESNQAIRKLQNQKRQLQQKNKNFIESQFKMKNQVELLKVKNVELVKQVKNIKELYETSEMIKQSQGQKTNTIMLDLQEKYKKASRELQIKQSQNHQLSLYIRQLDSKCSQLQSRLKMYENQRRIKSKEAGLMQIQNKNEIQELISAYELKLKQWELKSSAMGVEEVRYKTMSEERQGEIRQLRKHLHLKQIETEQLMQSQKEFKSKEKERKLELENKCAQIDSLVSELNHYQEELLKQKMLHSQTIKKYETQLIRQHTEMQVLEQDVKNIQAASSMEKMQNNALQSIFSSQKQQVNEKYRAFVELEQRRTLETNALRQQLQVKGEQMHRVQMENQQLKNRIRRVEQENELGGRTLTVNLNNLKQAKEANEMVLRCEVQSLKRKIASLQMRLKNKQNQIVQKNRFIKQFLMPDISQREDASTLVVRLQEALSK